MLPTGYACALAAPPTRPLAVAVQALTLLVQRRLITDVALYSDRVDVMVLPPLCPLRILATDFRHAEQLRSRAHASAAAWLDSARRTVHNRSGSWACTVTPPAQREV